MSDKVIPILDSFTPSLHLLLRLGIFSSTEITSIVSSRSKSEYLLARRSPRKSDFLDYLAHEQKLEKLHVIRRKKVFDSNGDQSNADRNEGVGCIIKHIHFIFDRLCMKFGRGDITTYTSYITYCKSTNNAPTDSPEQSLSGKKKVGKIYGRALQLHPLSASLWVGAASYEAFTMGNFSGGRSLLQRALRVNRGSDENRARLWKEMIRLEATVVEVNAGRQEYAKKRKRGGVGGDNNDISYDISVLTVIIKSALSQNPTLPFHAETLDLLLSDFPHVDQSNSLPALVMDSLTKQNIPERELLIAEYKLNANDHKAAFSALREAIEHSPLTKTYVAAAEFVYDVLVDTEGVGVVGKAAETFYKEILLDAQKRGDGVFDAKLCLMLGNHLDDGDVIRSFLQENEGDAELWIKYAELSGREGIGILKRGVSKGVEGLKVVLLNLLLENEDEDIDKTECERLIMGGVTDVERGALLTSYFKARPTPDTVKFALKNVSAGGGLAAFYDVVLAAKKDLHLGMSLRRRVWEAFVQNVEEGEIRNEALSRWEAEEQEAGNFEFASNVGARRLVVS